MATIFETTGAPRELGAGLQQGVNTLSYNQDMPFDLYKRLVLPIDGFAFWIKASLLPEYYDSLYNTTPMNQTTPNQGAVKPVLTPLQAKVLHFRALGSLHLTQVTEMQEAKVYTRQRVVFTCLQEVDHLDATAPDEMYFTTLPNGSKAAFSALESRYFQSGLWHYVGLGLFNVNSTQVIDDLSKLDTSQIVSNSLPIWLSLGTNELPVYPSYLSLANINPPYVVADITSTTALASAPTYYDKTSQYQLSRDEVRFTMWGLNNAKALDWQYKVLNQSYFLEYGIGNCPVPVDEKEPQNEFQVIGQKKSMVLTVNYYQERARNIAMQLIERALVSYTVL
jgi:hypothetical protein